MKYLLPLLMIFAVGSLSAKVLAQTGARFDQDGFVHAVEDYLQNLDTAYARFAQTAPDGTRLVGTFYLDRPGKLRFEYDDLDDFVVADGRFIYFYDAELDEQTNAPIGQTLADFILRPELDLGGELVVTDIYDGETYDRITLAQAEDLSAGSLTLAFEVEPFTLSKWRIIDATGNITEVELYNLQTDVDLDDDLFVYRDPTPRAPYEFNE